MILSLSQGAFIQVVTEFKKTKSRCEDSAGKQGPRPSWRPGNKEARGPVSPSQRSGERRQTRIARI